MRPPADRSCCAERRAVVARGGWTSGLPELENLLLDRSAVTDEDWKQLAVCESQHIVYAAGTRVTAAEVKELLPPFRNAT